MTEDEMVGRHHQLNGHEFEQMLSNSRVTFSLWLIHCCNTYSISGFEHWMCLHYSWV